MADEVEEVADEFEYELSLTRYELVMIADIESKAENGKFHVQNFTIHEGEIL